jgi:glycosyltransferase involved in cell wall biosynthesis
MDPMQPFFSIVIVVFNGIETISEAIKSVISQDFIDRELIIIDGDSTDGTIQCINEFENHINYFISEPDNGIYDAMNKAIRASRGEFIFFLGSDDVFLNSTVLSRQYEFMQSTPAHFYYGNVVMSNSGEVYDGSFNYKKLLRKNISHQAIFYHSSIFSKIGLFDLRFKLHADWDFNLKCFASDEINCIYTDLIIAIFKEGNSSAKPDKLFITHKLVPEIVEYNKKNPDFLNAIQIFDYLWRQFRNSGITSAKDIILNPDNKPTYIFIILSFQSVLPGKMLMNGFISKILMSVCYLYCKLTKSI